MRVGIDARTLLGQRSGVGYFLSSIIEAGAFNGHTVTAFYDPSGERKRPDLDIPPHTNVEWTPLEPPRWTAPLGRVASVWWFCVSLSQAVSAEDFDAFFGPNFVLPPFLSCPSVVVIHDLVHRVYPETHLLPYRLYLRTFIPISLRTADHILTVSDSTRQDLIECHEINTDSVSVTYGAAGANYQPRMLSETQREQLRDKYGLPPEFLLYVGNLEPRKNLSVVLRALESFNDANRPPLVIVGQEHLTNKSFDRIYQESSAASTVHFTGYVPEDDLPLLYNLARAFIYPSLYEGFGLPVVEAMQSGTPVICSTGGSLPEVVSNAGVTVDATDPSGFAEAIERVWNDEELRDKLIDSGLERTTDFSWERTATDINRVLEEIA